MRHGHLEAVFRRTKKAFGFHMRISIVSAMQPPAFAVDPRSSKCARAEVFFGHASFGTTEKRYVMRHSRLGGPCARPCCRCGAGNDFRRYGKYCAARQCGEPSSENRVETTQHYRPLYRSMMRPTAGPAGMPRSTREAENDANTQGRGHQEQALIGSAGSRADDSWKPMRSVWEVPNAVTTTAPMEAPCNPCSSATLPIADRGRVAKIRGSNHISTPHAGIDCLIGLFFGNVSSESRMRCAGNRWPAVSEVRRGAMGSIVLLDLMGGVALLLWGLHMVRSGIMRAFGSDLRRFLDTALRNRFLALRSPASA